MKKALLIALMLFSTVAYSHNIEITAVKVGNVNTQLKTTVADFTREEIAVSLKHDVNVALSSLHIVMWAYDSTYATNNVFQGVRDIIQDEYQVPNWPRNASRTFTSSRELNLTPGTLRKPYYLIVAVYGHYVNGADSYDFIKIRIKPRPQAPLPVTLTLFEGKADGNGGVALRWNTASEQNSSHFLVEKSVDGATWVTAGRVNTKGAGAYGFTDIRQGDARYYRLKTVDNDGTFAFSSVVTVSVNNSDKVLTTSYINMAGQLISQPLQGLYIEVVTYGSGRVVKKKIFRE